MNAQSLNNKAGEFADFVCKYKADVVAIMETWFHEIESASCTLCTSPGYSLLDHPWSNCTGGGTGVLFIDTLNVTKIAAAEFQPFEYSEWNIKSESEQIHLIIIYRPPYSEVHPVTTSVFLEEFLEFLESTVFTSSHLLITRDFNIHMRWDYMTYSRALGLSNMWLFQLISYCSSIPWTDYLFSGHLPVHCKAVKFSFKRSQISFRKVKSISADILQDELSSTDLC